MSLAMRMRFSSDLDTNSDDLSLLWITFSFLKNRKNYKIRIEEDMAKTFISSYPISQK
jgi:hypothetical protein